MLNFSIKQANIRSKNLLKISAQKLPYPQFYEQKTNLLMEI